MMTSTRRMGVVGVIGAAGLGSAAFGQQCGSATSPTATYQVVFDAEWSQATHPTTFPGDPHFSPLIGGTHSDAVVFWEPGGIATLGIERMAETGSPSVLRFEVNEAIAMDTAHSVVEGGGIGTSPNEVSTSFDMVDDNPLITLVTMIAPSPDWFVGVHGLNLRPNGAWVDTLTVDLDAYDSGTDSGVNYTSPNANTNPQEPIRNISGEFPFAGHGRIGTFTFTRVDSVGCSAADIVEPCGVTDFFDVAAYIALFNAGDPAADFAAPFGQLNFFDISAFITEFTNGCP